MARLEPTDVLFFTSPGELRKWLESNHAAKTEAWIGFRPKAAGVPTITWPELVDEILCYGWIDGVRMPVEGGSSIRITPRRDGSIWSARNVGRVEALRAEGRMREPGEAAFARRRDDRTGVYSFERRSSFDAEGEAVLRAEPAAWAFWEAQPPGYRRLGTHWVMSAKRPDTRARRLAALVDACRRRERLPSLTGARPSTPPTP